MQKAYSRINWENYPSTETPVNETNLNKIDSALNTVDNRVVDFDTTKANQSDMLTTIVNISIDSNTGIITATRKNGTTITIDTNLEKIVTNFWYDDDPTSAHYQSLVLELPTTPVTYQYVDMSALITQFEFNTSAEVAFTVSNGQVSASIVNGSITENKLQPNFLADCRAAKQGAETAEAHANASDLKAEGFAVGEQNGIPVTIESPYYHNNAKYFRDIAQQIVALGFGGLSDVEFGTLLNGDVPIYNSSTQKWENGKIVEWNQTQTATDGIAIATITINGTPTTVYSPKVPDKIITATLPANTTTLTINNALITTTAMYDIYTSNMKELPYDINISAGTMTLYFNKVSTALDVVIKLREVS